MHQALRSFIDIINCEPSKCGKRVYSYSLFRVESFHNNGAKKIKYLKEHDPHKLLTSSVKKLTKLRNLDNYTKKVCTSIFLATLYTVGGCWGSVINKCLIHSIIKVKYAEHQKTTIKNNTLLLISIRDA